MQNNDDNKVKNINEVELRLNKEWLQKMADAEDGCCVSVGGLYVDLGLYDKPINLSTFNKLHYPCSKCASRITWDARANSFLCLSDPNCGWSCPISKETAELISNGENVIDLNWFIQKGAENKDESRRTE